ncbi:MAG: TraR/DksA C4-type zinc finger protein [Candidatus Spechtbacterales bacterium]
MIKKQLEHFGKILEEKKKRLTEELQDIADKDPHVKGDWDSKFPRYESEGFDIEEAPNEVEEYITRLPLEHQLELQLGGVKKALERIKGGTYGICGNCKKSIPIKRLELVPETELCLKCKK